MLTNSPVRPRLLFVCQLNPWRLNNGGVIRNYWLIAALAQRFDIDLITADEPDDSLPSDFRALCTDIRCYPRPRSIRAKLARALGALRPASSYYTSSSVTRAMRAGVAQLVATRTYSAIMTELGLIDALPAGDIPVVYSSHNCESALLLRRAKLEPAWLRFAVTLDALRVRRLESQLIERAVLTTPCSQNDLDDMAAFAPIVMHKAVVIPNGVDCASYAGVKDTTGEPGVVLITGSYDWVPNRRGLLWFLKDVLPILGELRTGKDFSVRVAGRMSAEFSKKLAEFPHVTAKRNVPRMDVELRDASVVAVPVIASSGTRLRILEAWAAGRPIVTTPHGAFGLEHRDGADLFSCATPRRFAEAVVALLDDASLSRTLREGGAARAAAYDWSVIGLGLLEAFESFGILPKAHKEEPATRVPS